MSTQFYTMSKIEKLQYLGNRLKAKGKAITPTKLMIESLFVAGGTILDTDMDVISFCKGNNNKITP